ncbi:MAG: DUF1003 domain-containing protein [Desulfobacterales bacterium]|jgi:uncharacterized membrane protein
MTKLHFPKPFEHSHPPIKNVNEAFEKQLTLGQRASDRIANIVGSWPFIIVQSILLTMWVILNVAAVIRHWDPYPFILMNLVLSTQAAYTAPIIMMSQNRQAERDRLEAHNDYIINQKAEEEIRAVMDHLETQNEALLQIYQILDNRKILINESA